MAVERAPQVRRFASPANGAKRGVRLEWEGKKAEIDVPVLPFQTIETINEPRQQLTLFSAPDDARPAFPLGWKNKLIWGDNKLAMAALAEQYAGQVDLIYIDPPFDTGADFSVSVDVAGMQVTKEANIIERHAYQDTWGRSLDSFLQMMFERLLLMRQLLAPGGAIYVHIGGRVTSYVMPLLDEIFGDSNYRNQLVVERSMGKNYVEGEDQFKLNSMYDTIYVYSNSEQTRLRVTDYNLKGLLEFPSVSAQQKGRQFTQRIDQGEQDAGGVYYWAPFDAPNLRPNLTYEIFGRWPPTGRCWAWNPDRAAAAVQRYHEAERLKGEIEDEAESGEVLRRLAIEGILFNPNGGGPRYKKYVSESRAVGDLWPDVGINDRTMEYPTAKSPRLLERILQISSKPGDLVADFFSGSGTTAAVAETLGRRWIACDLGRFAIHKTRKRLLDPNAKRCRAFEILNLGHYEQQFWQGVEGEDADDTTAKKRTQDYIRTMLAFYHARPLDGNTRVHGEKGGRAVHIGPLAESVSRMEAYEASESVLSLGFRGLDILGWEWDFESNETVKEEAKMRGVDLRLIQIPEEMLDGRARKLFQEGKLTFPELASLEVKIEPLPGQRLAYHAHLEDFIIPTGTLPEALRDRVTRWQDYIDYWSVDWEFGKDTLPGERDTFHNMWQTFRTRKDRTLALTSEPHDYTAPGTYTVVVKVVDIFGNDTTVSRKVEVP